MAENQTEMSLDEVLSSIRQMVVDKEPPVLELTDMISPDGTIVKVKNGQKDSKSKNELRDFLRLAQENGKDSSLAKDLSSGRRQSADDKGQFEFCAGTNLAGGFTSDCKSGSECGSVPSERGKGLPRHAGCGNPMTSDRPEITVNEIIREVAAPLIRDWLEKNLPNLAREVVTEEIRKMIKQS